MKEIKRILFVFLFFLGLFLMVSCKLDYGESKHTYNVVFVKYNQYNTQKKSGELIEKPLIKPYKRGFKFIGWYNEGKEFDFETKIYSNVVLIPYFVNITLLEKEIEKVEEIIKETDFESVYTENSKKEFKESLKKAIVRIKDNTRENEVIDTLNELKRKRIKLLTKYKEEEQNNKKKLLFIINKAQKKKKEKNYESRYTYTTRNELEKKISLAVKLYYEDIHNKEQIDKVFDKLLNAIENLKEITNDYYYEEMKEYKIELNEKSNKEDLNIIFKNLDYYNFISVKGSDIKSYVINHLLLNNAIIHEKEIGIEMQKGELRIYKKFKKGDVLKITKGLEYRAIKGEKIFILGQSENELVLEYDGEKFFKR